MVGTTGEHGTAGTEQELLISQQIMAVVAATEQLSPSQETMAAVAAQAGTEQEHHGQQADADAAELHGLHTDAAAVVVANKQL